MRNQIDVFERAVLVLRVIQNTPIASTSEIRDQALSGLSLRSTQRYLKCLEDAGYIHRKYSGLKDSRFFLTDKSKELFGVAV